MFVNSRIHTLAATGSLIFMVNNRTQKLILLVVTIFLLNLYSCGFAYEKRIKNQYYIIGVDDEKERELSYKLSSGDYVGRAPGQLLQYGISDSFLVVKTQGHIGDSLTFYIINMNKDSELALEENFRVGPISEEEYYRTWNPRLNIKLIDVK